jgi:hypothetical protein
MLTCITESCAVTDGCLLNQVGTVNFMMVTIITGNRKITESKKGVGDK